MQIKIEIDVKPDELRRFLGLPDVAGLQEDVVRFIREKVGAAGDSFDPAAVMQGSFDLIRRTPAWRRLKTAWEGTDAEQAAFDEAVAEATAKARPSASKKRARGAATRKRSARKSAAAAGETPPES